MSEPTPPEPTEPKRPQLPKRCPDCGGGAFVIVTDPDGNQTIRCCVCDWREDV